MDHSKFFAAIRPHFGGSLSGNQVKGMEALLKAGEKHELPLQHMANVLAQSQHETGNQMFPIKETVMPYHKDKNPPDVTVIARLDAAFKSGQLKWVKTPYWRTGFFGRGFVQITHEGNYDLFSKILGIDLVKNPSKALDLDNAATIAVVGMKQGKFTGKKLSDYVFPSALFLKPEENPRRIINGKDGTDSLVAKYHLAFVPALEAAGWGRKAQLVKLTPANTSPAVGASILAKLFSWFKGTK